MDGDQPNTKQVLIVGQSASGDVAELQIKNVNQPEVSFNVARGAEASLSYRDADEMITCTTALTMDNDSSVNIEVHDSITNTLTGSFTAVNCATLASETNELSEGTFHVNYEEVEFQNKILFDIGGVEVDPSSVFLRIIPEPMNIIQIIGFNGGTENYTLILKSGLPAGTYRMNEFDVAPYFFFTDNDLNQYDAVSGTVTIEPYNKFDRILRGSFDILTQSDQTEVKCTGDFEIFVF